jgi:peptidoglycan/LPS O-acetylase OafA/YrhL
VVFVFFGASLGLGAEIDIATKFVAYFLAGAVLQVMRKHVGISGAGAAIASAIFLTATALAPAWGGQVTSVALAYALLWLGSTITSPSLIHRHDVSYGMYIYAFQVQQLFAVFGAWRWGYWPFALAALSVTILLAVPSWFFVEKPIMDWTRRRLAILEGKRNPEALQEAPS